MSLTNGQIAELLASAGDGAEGHRRRAYGRASGAALLWDEEVADVVARGERASSLEWIGDRLGARIEAWLEDPPEIDEPPARRRDFSTYAVALRSLRDDQTWSAEVRGDLQMHTTYSDGDLTIRGMALESATMGRDYVAITDHSQSLPVVRGMDEAAIVRQGAEIDVVNDELARDGLDFTVLKSIEMDLDGSGEGDTDPAVLGDLDLVLGTFHTALRAAEDQTARYVGALRNPHVHVLGHPRGRRWNRRPGLTADWERVFDEAAARGKALEIDAYPHRQDLQPELLPLAASAGVRISIGTDAHDANELRFLEVGLAAARDAGIPKDRILNFMSADEVRAWATGLRDVR